MKGTFTFQTLLATLLLLVSSIFSYAGEKGSASPDLTIYYRVGSAAVDTTFRANGEQLEELFAAVADSLSAEGVSISSILIRSGASPEGAVSRNTTLTRGRGVALKNYLQRRLNLPDSVFTLEPMIEDWLSLQPTTKESQYPDLRFASAEFAFTTVRQLVPAEAPAVEPEPEVQPAEQPAPEPILFTVEIAEPKADTAAAAKVAEIAAAAAAVDAVGSTEEPTAPSVAAELAAPATYIRKPLFALKTNLLFDALTAINAEIEVPIGRQFSVAGEFIFPDWVDRATNKFCLQANISSIEARYWFGHGPKASRPREALTGHFVGAYGQWGNFDFQPFTDHGWKVNRGYAYGISYGYAHPINKAKTLRLEYSLGIAYAWADYYKYQVEAEGTILASKDEWHYNTTIFPLPTKAKVSLVWLLTYRRKQRSK